MVIDKKLVFSLLFLLCGLGILGVVYFKFARGILAKPDAGLVVTSSDQVTVILDGSLVGKTPYQSDTLKPGEHSLSIKSDTGSYDAKIKLVSLAQTAVSREVGIGKPFSSGYVIWMEKVGGNASSVSVVSDPANADVSLDSAKKGSTPLALDNVSPSTHTLEISKAGYEPQTIYLKFKEGFKLNVLADLFLIPIPTSLQPITYSDSITLYNLSLSDYGVNVSPNIWAQAVAYYGKTRSENPVTFDYFIDSDGNAFDSAGSATTPDKVPSNAQSLKIGYLSPDKGDLTDKAKEALSKLGGSTSDKIKILPTGFGWLRVRSEPSLNGTEVGRVNEGDIFSVISKQSGWVEIKMSDGMEGWVNASYVQDVK